jgi:murein DD-endopeptidase MepM/ murein hydrolase activator NlpD
MAQPASAMVLRPPTDAPVHAPYGPRENPITKARSTHAGIDYATAKGAPVLAPADGVVVYAGWYGGYGRVVMLDHGGELVTLLGHLDRALVKMGQIVKAGDRIATAGATGMAPVPQTHFEVRRRGQAVDPAAYLSQ